MRAWNKAWNRPWNTAWGSTRRLLTITGICTLAAWPGTAQATENGAIAYPVGVNTLMAGALPGPGETWWQNYTVYYRGNTFTDARGRSSVPGFKADVFVNAARFLHTWNTGSEPFRLASGVVIPLLHTNVRTAFGSERNAGVGDITVQPLYFGWTNSDKTFFGYAGIDVYLPTKSNVSNNFFSVNPTVYMTWLPAPKLELSAAAGVEFHTEHGRTRYRSGPLFLLDWGVNYRPFESTPGLSVGVGGYFVQQLSDDLSGGAPVQNGFRQRNIAIGPQVSFGTPAGAVAIKWQHEFETKNRPEGDRFWFQFLLPLKI